MRRVLASGYEVLNFIKCLKEYRVHRARFPNINSRKKKSEPCSCKLKKIKIKEEILYFPKPKNREGIIRCSVIKVHVR